MLGLIAYWRSQGSSRLAAWATVAVASLPIVFDHATQAYANLPFATYLILGSLLAAQAQTSSRSGLSILSGICLGLAVWTRPEGVILVTTLCLSLWLVGRRASPPWKPGLRWLGPVLVLGGGWVLFTLANDATGIAPGLLSEAALGLSRGDLHLSSFYWIARFLARDLLNPSMWGLFLLLLAAGGIAALRGRKSIRGLKVSPILATSAALGLPIVVFYYLVSFSGDLAWWLDTGLSRLLLPSALLLAVWSASQWITPRNVGEPVAGVEPIDP
jgi:hypothetical protein